jgi:hypothetical protein
MRKIIGETKQPCQNPVLTSKGYVNFPLWIT